MLVPIDVKEKSRIRFENNQCIVEGRSFSTDHVVLVKPSSVKITMDEEGVRMEAEYEGMPKFSTYGNYIVIGVSSDRYIPSWEKLEGTVLRVDEKGGEARGEVGIRGSLSRGYAVLEVVGSDAVPNKIYAKELKVHAKSPDFVNVLGSRFQTFYIKTKKDSKIDISKEEEKITVTIE
ncbi:MAG: hypothetical protein GXO07_00035 [Crenarchaeota archaeon]|nr:hypothetical protein [Thermoproteota archaeon]